MDWQLRTGLRYKVGMENTRSRSASLGWKLAFFVPLAVAVVLQVISAKQTDLHTSVKLSIIGNVFLTLSLIAQAGAQVLFLPAYSPDLNPIEKMWSKVKQHLRSAEARTEPDLLQKIGQALDSVTAKDVMHWFASCGYSFI